MAFAEHFDDGVAGKLAVLAAVRTVATVFHLAGARMMRAFRLSHIEISFSAILRRSRPEIQRLGYLGQSFVGGLLFFERPFEHMKRLELIQRGRPGPQRAIGRDFDVLERNFLDGAGNGPSSLGGAPFAVRAAL
jgi:hypothetical protein